MSHCVCVWDRCKSHAPSFDYVQVVNEMTVSFFPSQEASPLPPGKWIGAFEADRCREPGFVDLILVCLMECHQKIHIIITHVPGGGGGKNACVWILTVGRSVVPVVGTIWLLLSLTLGKETETVLRRAGRAAIVVVFEPGKVQPHTGQVPAQCLLLQAAFLSKCLLPA